MFAIIEDSLFFYGAAPFLLQQGVPVVGVAIDGTVWTIPSNTNLFPADGVFSPDYVHLIAGMYMKDRGVTSCAGLGIAGSPSAK